MAMSEQTKNINRETAPILIVEEDYNLSHSIIEQLKHKGFNVYVASNCQQALVYLSNHVTSIVIASNKNQNEAYLNLLKQAKELKPETQRIFLEYTPLSDVVYEQIQPVRLLKSPFDSNLFIQNVKDAFVNFQFQLEYKEMLSFLNKQHDVNEGQESLSLDRAQGSKILQKLLLDTPPSNLPGVDLHVYTLSSESIDGDFIAFFKPNDHLLDVALGDVMGKGLSSALIALNVKERISHFSQPFASKPYLFDHERFWQEEIPNIKEILQELHRTTVEKLLSLEYYISLFYGRLDLHRRIFTFIDCGFTNPIYFRHASQKAIPIRSSNFPLGTVQYHEYSPFEIHYDEGDFFVLYSDGITEAKSKQGELFGEVRLIKCIENYGQLPLDQISKNIKKEVSLFTDEECLEDDFTLVIIKIDELCPIAPDRPGVAKFNSVLAQLEPVRKLTQELCCKAPGHIERLSSEMKLVIDEAFTNIVIHGYNNKPGSPICVRAEYLKNEIMIEISDQGRSFHPSYIPDLNLIGEREEGYGWFLISNIADRVVYVPKKTQSGWNHLRIYKHYHKNEAPMELFATDRDGVLVIRLESDTLDARKVPEFKEQVLKLIDEKNASSVVFDLQKLQFIDSSGLGAFLSLLRQLNTRGGHLSLSAMTKPVKSIFELVSMQKIFECFDTLDQAIQANEKA